MEALHKLWTRYPSIENHHNTTEMKLLSDTGHTERDVIWVATEKVHGANFSLLTDGKYIAARKFSPFPSISRSPSFLVPREKN